MNNIKATRTVGNILLFIGVIYAAYNFFSLGFFEEYLTNIYDLNNVFSLAFTIVGLLVINIFLWIGILLLWRADEDEKPDQKSIWHLIIIIYLILSAIYGIGYLIHI